MGVWLFFNYEGEKQVIDWLKEAQLTAGRGAVSADGEQPPTYSPGEGLSVSYSLHQKWLVTENNQLYPLAFLQQVQEL